ncbi:hypothetical protein ACIBAH_18155 [Streptomyces sp. NPDC051445]
MGLSGDDLTTAESAARRPPAREVEGFDPPQQGAVAKSKVGSTV